MSFSPTFNLQLLHTYFIITLSLTGVLISTPVRHNVVTEYVYKDCKLKVGEKVMLANLVLLDIRDFDVILGMDWLAVNHAILDCYAKIVMFSIPEKCVVRFEK